MKIWTHVAAQEGSFKIDDKLKQRLNTFFADPRQTNIEGIKTTDSVTTPVSAPFLRDGKSKFDYGSANVNAAVKVAYSVTTEEFAAVNRVPEGFPFWEEQTYFLELDGKPVIAAHLKDQGPLQVQDKETIALVDPDSAKLLAIKTKGDWFTAPFTDTELR